VFSPWYRWSGRRDPADHCCLNVVTCGPGGRWTMTDRGRSALRLSADSLRIGPSAMHWDGRQLTVEIDEATWPRPGRLRGRVVLTPAAVTAVEAALTPSGAHVWRPFAPVAEVRVDLDRPGWTWDGHGYLDANFGTAALEADFDFWTWGRFPTARGAVVHYDARRRDGGELALGVAFDREGGACEVKAPPAAALGPTLWRLARTTRADAGYRPAVVRSLLDAPFYARAMVRSRFDGDETVGVHESLDLRRFRHPWLMPMLALRVPRRARWTPPG
jgi:carotenoid 1,2-hydratase